MVMALCFVLWLNGRCFEAEPGGILGQNGLESCSEASLRDTCYVDLHCSGE